MDVKEGRVMKPWRAEVMWEEERKGQDFRGESGGSEPGRREKKRMSGKMKRKMAGLLVSSAFQVMVDHAAFLQGQEHHSPKNRPAWIL